MCSPEQIIRRGPDPSWMAEMAEMDDICLAGRFAALRWTTLVWVSAVGFGREKAIFHLG